MAIPVIIDIGIVVILFLFVLHGAKRGLFLSLCSLVAVIVALFGSSFVADTLAPQVAKSLEPQIASVIESSLSDITSSYVPEASASDNPLFEILVDSGLYDQAVQAVEGGLIDTTAGLVITLATLIAEDLAYCVIFTLSFLLLLVLWSLLSHALNLVTRLPVLHSLNGLGGGLFGLLKGGLLLFICAFVLRYLGGIISTETIEASVLLNFFMTTNPVTLILSAGTVLDTVTSG